jgi:uncharacterized protein (TIGR00369 family)
MENNLIEKYIAHNQFGKLIGMEFKIISDGHLEYYLTVNKNHLATPLAAHGGLIAALIDGALGVAALSSVHNENKVVSTIEYKTNFMNPALLNDQLKAIAKVEQKGKRIIIVSCDVLAANRNDIIVAKALGTFNAYDAAKAGY